MDRTVLDVCPLPRAQVVILIFFLLLRVKQRPRIVQLNSALDKRTSTMGHSFSVLTKCHTMSPQTVNRRKSIMRISTGHIIILGMC